VTISREDDRIVNFVVVEVVKHTEAILAVAIPSVLDKYI
jgi:hypothetical protein